MDEQKYVFRKSTSNKQTVRIEKTESELTFQERQLLYGNLIEAWNNTPGDIQLKFMKEVISSAEDELYFKIT